MRDSFEILVQEIYNVRSHEEMIHKMNPNSNTRKLVFNDENFDDGNGKSGCC